ncbi:DUF6046 domain-containing protein [Fibrella sp. WM1]|uniref:DUF6046 domain-containing protein n=1 Tax=Fibrella musci TaxID=3242485 RepID=UPI003520FBE6
MKSEVIVPSTGMVMQCPVSISIKRDGSDAWTLPLEPTVSVSGGATIVRRQVNSAAGRVGSVKEEWSQNDPQISVSGVLIGEGEYPETDVADLKKMLTSGVNLQIRCVLLDTLGITQMTVESWDFPATSGLENQTYTFSGYADTDFELLI